MCGVISSRSSKKPMPSRKPTAAGKKDSFPIPSLLSSAGCSRLQKDAATITPAAKPVNSFCILSDIWLFSRNTIAAPRHVPRKGIMILRKTAKDIQSPSILGQ